MKAVIPAAGRGARLGPLTADRPKPLIEVGGRPVLARVIDAVAPNVTGVVIVVGYRGDQIRSAVARWEVDVPVWFVDQEEALGTADALLRARSEVGDEAFVYAWGDVLVPPGLVDDVVATATGDVGVVAVDAVDDVAPGADVTIDRDGWVVDVVEKPDRHGPGWNASGVGVLPADAWQMLATVESSPRGELELTDVLRRLALAGRLRAVVSSRPVIDVGTPERLARGERQYGVSGGR